CRGSGVLRRIFCPSSISRFTGPASAPEHMMGAVISELNELDRLCPVPQGQPTEFGQSLGSFDDRDEMVTGELADFAGETDAAIGEQNFGFADAAGMKEKLTRRRIAGRVLVTEAEIQVAEWDPTRFAAPPHMDQLLPVWQHAGEFCAS